MVQCIHRHGPIFPQCGMISWRSDVYLVTLLDENPGRQVTCCHCCRGRERALLLSQSDAKLRGPTIFQRHITGWRRRRRGIKNTKRSGVRSESLTHRVCKWVAMPACNYGQQSRDVRWEDAEGSESSPIISWSGNMLKVSSLQVFVAST